MITTQSIKEAYARISEKMKENRDYLIQLDRQNGDGDLGISMDDGFRNTSEIISVSEEIDLGKLMLLASKTFNESAPSSLGTILSIGMMGMAKALKGKSEVDVATLGEAMKSGLNAIMDKAGSKPGEKTILDSLFPGTEALIANATSEDAYTIAAKAAADGSESTRDMRSVHGRAAYYAEKSLGVLDGGSVVGKLIFEGIAGK